MKSVQRPARRWLLPLLLWAWVLPGHAAPLLQPLDRGLSAAESAATHELLTEATGLLTPAWRDALSHQAIGVEWRDNLPAQIHARATARKILLDRALLRGWMARDRSAGRTDPAARAALAALVHELAHFLDRSPAGKLSRDPRLLDLAGWPVRPFRWAPRKGHNAFSDRSPDPYELESPAEFVAVNLEHFLLDAAYACRRPALHDFFRARLGAPSTPPGCAQALPLVQAAEPGEQPLLRLDPARVQAVDYLLAGANEQAMSRWGHSMLRLVVCAPGRPAGSDCRLDLDHHLVLSFRAFVDDVQISSWRGLTGSYPSRLFVLPLAQVVDEYTKIELRELRSIPLRLTPDEIHALLERAAHVHWSYDGRYFFVSNNCAVETFRLLHDGVPRLAGARLDSITPKGLLRRLERAGIADPSVLADDGQAIRLGYRFQAADAHYRRLYAAAHRPGMPARVEDWLALTPRQRLPWLEDPAVDLRAAAGLLLLEQAAARRLELQAHAELKRRVFRRPDTDAASMALHTARALLLAEGLLARPAALLPDAGYGLPQPQELASAEGRITAQAGLTQQGREQLLTLARDWLPPGFRNRLDDSRANLEHLGERLRRLHRAQGGLEL